jgi:hypothetical protein
MTSGFIPKGRPCISCEEIRLRTKGQQAIVCKEAPTLANIIHEFGHTAPNHMNFDILNKVDSIPYDNGLLDDKNGSWIRQYIGFKKDEDSSEHKINSNNESRVDGYAKVEQLADMLMNWNMEQAGSTTHGFSDNAAGRARRDFTEGLIQEMLSKQ